MKILKNIAPALLTVAANSVLAHSGHGMPGATHWHATDTAGLAVVVVGALLALWIAGKE